MKISVRVRTKAKQERVEETGEGILSVWVKEAADKGKANVAVIRALAGHFKVPRNSVKIVSGLASRQKIIIIDKL
ncbi:MAG: DUF167 domain-containing protein [Candidatus Pacebacteria bacterium]|nr:DUF167 domain-containing protein [Candidatus Paceibacterota bacterium]